MNPIVTLTLNPCLDQITGVDRVEPDRKLRMNAPRYEPGGGGINVARAIHRLGGETLAVHTAGGPMGELLGELLDKEAVNHSAVEIEGNTRINPNVFEHGSDRLYRFIMPGPTIAPDALDRCGDCLLEAISQADYLVISGSLPPDVPDRTYVDIASRARASGKRVLLDTSGDALKRAVGQGVYLIKPNLRELRELTGEALDSDRQIADAGRKLIAEQAVEVVLVSLGGGGAMLITADQAERIATPTVTIRSKVGAGDSLTGALALSLGRGDGLRRAAQFGIAAGAAAVMTPGTELCRREDTERLFNEMTESKPVEPM